ncbi:VWA domain-containing protein [Psychrobacter sp. ANT_WB68]|nr:VWA domain-containing protein [Psychrobacter sp. ANT_WB68]
MTGGMIDNCSFFELDDLNDVSEKSFYESMLEEFPSWLNEACKIGLITS